jgi:hypothetical protein
VPGIPGLNRAAEALDYRKGDNLSGYEDFGSSLRDLPRLRSSRRRRASSWDRSGGNDDRLHVEPGATVTLAEISGAGSAVVPELRPQMRSEPPPSKRIGRGPSRTSSRSLFSTSLSSAPEAQILPSLRVFSIRTSLASAGFTLAHMVRAAATAISSVGMTMGVLTGAGVVEVRAFM